jgi:FlaA1/EpsC-like NDP-sugar epimerase
MKMPDKIFSAASYCTSGGLICTGLAQTYDWFHGLDWNFIALASGVVIGVATYLTNLYYKRRWTKCINSLLTAATAAHLPRIINMANLKTKLSAAMLALIAAGASAPVLFDQFISEKEGNALVAVVDPGGVWSLCHGVTVINGKPVIRGKEQLRRSVSR